MTTYTIKIERTALAHIAGLTTRSGREIHAIPASAETGRTHGDLADAVGDIRFLGLPMCPTCRTAAELIQNRLDEEEELDRQATAADRFTFAWSTI